MNDKLKSFSSSAIGIAMMVGFVVIIMFFIKGGVWLSEKIFPILYYCFGFTVWIFLLVLLPLAFFRKTRSISSQGMYLSSFVFGATLWVSCFLLTYNLWGAFALFIGLAFMGIGVVPIALLATLFNGMWSTFGEIVLTLAMTYGARALSIYVATKCKDTEKSIVKPQIDNDAILIVDDERNFLDVLSQELNDAGFNNIDTAENGMIAINKLEAGKYKLVLTGLNMPVLDGFSLLKFIKENMPLTKSVVISGLHDDAIVAQAMELGAFAYFKKPPNVDQLIATVKRIMRD